MLESIALSIVAACVVWLVVATIWRRKTYTFSWCGAFGFAPGDIVCIGDLSESFVVESVEEDGTVTVGSRVEYSCIDWKRFEASVGERLQQLGSKRNNGNQ